MGGLLSVAFYHFAARKEMAARLKVAVRNAERLMWRKTSIPKVTRG
jgi:hypothetical protein